MEVFKTENKKEEEYIISQDYIQGKIDSKIVEMNRYQNLINNFNLDLKESKEFLAIIQAKNDVENELRKLYKLFDGKEKEYDIVKMTLDENNSSIKIKFVLLLIVSIIVISIVFVINLF